MYSRKAQLATRRHALLVALVCLWMSGVATTMHADDLRGLVSKPSHGPVTLSHALPQPPQEPCAACEWNQFGRTLCTPEIRIAYSSLHLIDRPDTLAVALHLRAFDHILFRGPPALS